MLIAVAVGAALMLSSSCSLFGKKKAKWTILAYYDGNCNLDTTRNTSSWIIAEAQELEKVGSTDQVQVVAMMASLKTGGQCKYYHLEKHDNELPDQISSTVLENLGTKDMSDKRTLTDFIKYGREKYPAEKYMLMIKNHGSGWRGCCVDDQNGAGNMMSMPDFRAALDTFHFEVIAFDACLMGMAEVAYELRANADYMVASQFITYAGTYGGAEWLGYLTANSGATGLDLAKKIVEACLNADIAKQFTGQMAAIDLSKMDALAAKISDLGTNLITSCGQYGQEILHAFNNTHVTEIDDPAFCDLREFCRNVQQEPHLKEINVIRDAANNLISALNDAVSLTMTNAVSIPRGGLNIHFPWRHDWFDSSNYVKCQFRGTNWHAFLSQFIAAVGGGGGGGVGNIHIVSNPAGATVWYDNQNTGYTTPVTIQNAPVGVHSIKLTLAGYNDWIDNNVQVNEGQTTEVSATMTQGGGGAATVSGTVSWPGHNLSNYCVALLDTSTGSNIVYIAIAQVNPANGAFTLSCNLAQAVNTYVDGWDDVNNNSSLDAGDGLGWWDRNGDQEWNAADMFQLSPGQQMSGAQVVLYDVNDNSRLRGEGLPSIARTY
jgi:hypothetical protein